MATHSSILAWRIATDRGAWQTTVHGVTKESDTTEVTEHACMPPWEVACFLITWHLLVAL